MVVFKKNGGKFLGNFRGEIQRLEENAVNKNTVKTPKSWMNVSKS